MDALDFLGHIVKDRQTIQEAWRIRREYKDVYVLKGNGEVRILSVPPIKVKKAQKMILEWLRDGNFISSHPRIHGLVGSSCFNFIKGHCGTSQYFYSFDIKHAYDSTPVPLIYENLLRILSNKESLLLRAYFESETGKGIQELAKTIIELTTYSQASPKRTENEKQLSFLKRGSNSILPQGAPTSPALFFVVLKTMMEKIERDVNLSEHKLSCYGDNFLISSPSPINPEVADHVLAIVKSFGFTPHKTFQHNIKQGALKICGYTIAPGNGGKDKTRIGIDKSTIRRIRALCCKAQYTTRYKDPRLYRRLQGCLAWITPVYGGNRHNLPNQIKKPLRKIGTPLKCQSKQSKRSFLLKKQRPKKRRA